MSESDPTGAVDVDTEVGAIGTGEDNTHSGKKGKTKFAKVLRDSSSLYLIYVFKERWFQNLLFKIVPGLFLRLPVIIHSNFLFHQALSSFK